MPIALVIMIGVGALIYFMQQPSLQVLTYTSTTTITPESTETLKSTEIGTLARVAYIFSEC